MGILENFSHSQNCIKSTNKIPPYATNYKKEYLFIRGINKEFNNLVNNNLVYDYEDILNYLKRLEKIINKFIIAQDRKIFKEVSFSTLNFYDFLKCYYDQIWEFVFDYIFRKCM